MSRSKKLNYWIIGLLIIIVVHLYILGRLVFFPYPELFIYSYLTDQGLLPYKQIFDQHFPGLMFFPINLHTLGMTTPQIARIWHLGIVAFTHVLLFVVARKIFKSEKWALFANFLYLIWQPFFEGYVLWIDSFVPLLLLPSFYFIYQWTSEDKKKHLFWSGLFLGLALLFKQVTLPLIILVFGLLFLKSRSLFKSYPFFLGISIPVALLLFYIFSIGVWQDFFYWTVTFNLTTFAQMGRKYPDLIGLVGATPVFGVAVVSWFIYVIKDKAKEFQWLGVFLFGSLIFAFARFDNIHLQPALPFALLILVYLFIRIPKKFHQPIYLGFIALSFIFLIPFFKTHKGDKVFFWGEFERKVSSKVSELARPQDKVFAFGAMPHLYQMTNTLPPGNIFVFQFPWFMKIAENRVLSGIINDPPKVIVRDKGATTGGTSLIDNMLNINEYIEGNYKVIERIDGTEIMVKNLP